MFTALALGLALPYLLLTLQPAWTRLLPRPGAWMEMLKQLTAVPLFATVIWLAWVYGRLYSGAGAAAGQGSDHMARLLLGFLLLAIAGWVIGAVAGAVGMRPIAALVLGAVAIATPLYAREGYDAGMAAVHAGEARCGAGAGSRSLSTSRRRGVCPAR